MASFRIKRVKSVLLGESEPVQVRRPERLEGTLREHVPEPHGKWLLLRVGDSGRLIGGRVTLTVQIVTRVIHHVVSQVREAAGTSGRPGREPGGRTLNPCEPLLPPCPRPPPSRPRCPQSDSKSVRPAARRRGTHAPGRLSHCPLRRDAGAGQALSYLPRWTG